MQSLVLFRRRSHRLSLFEYISGVLMSFRHTVLYMLYRSRGLSRRARSAPDRIAPISVRAVTRWRLRYVSASAILELKDGGDSFRRLGLLPWGRTR